MVSALSLVLDPTAPLACHCLQILTLSWRILIDLSGSEVYPVLWVTPLAGPNARSIAVKCRHPVSRCHCLVRLLYFTQTGEIQNVQDGKRGLYNCPRNASSTAGLQSALCYSLLPCFPLRYIAACCVPLHTLSFLIEAACNVKPSNQMHGHVRHEAPT